MRINKIVYYCKDKNTNSLKYIRNSRTIIIARIVIQIKYVKMVAIVIKEIKYKNSYAIIVIKIIALKQTQFGKIHINQ